MPELTTCEDASAWDAFVSQARDASLLQSWAWGSLKSRYGWQPRRYLWVEAGRPTAARAVRRRRLPGGLYLDYAPRGPILDGQLEHWPDFWPALRERLAQDGGTVLKVDPEWTTDAERAALTESGALPSRHPIQHQATMLVDISGGDQALMRLKESTRRNIRAGQKQGITVEASDASAAMAHFYGLLEETAVREHFTVRSRVYYQDLLNLFRERGQVKVYLARQEDRLLAGAVMLFFGSKLVYLYGGTRSDAKDLKPGYLLQSWKWGELQSRFGWRVERLAFHEGRSGVCSLQRSGSLYPGGAVYYVPRGPVVVERERLLVLDELERRAAAGRGLVLRVEPSAVVGDEWPAFFEGRGVVRAKAVQTEATRLVRSDVDPDSLNAGFKPKTRYNLNLAEKKGVRVRGSRDVATFARLAAETGKRQGIHLPGVGYYQAALDL